MRKLVYSLLPSLLFALAVSAQTPPESTTGPTPVKPKVAHKKHHKPIAARNADPAKSANLSDTGANPQDPGFRRSDARPASDAPGSRGSDRAGAVKTPASNLSDGGANPKGATYRKSDTVEPGDRPGATAAEKRAERKKAAAASAAPRSNRADTGADPSPSPSPGSR